MDRIESLQVRDVGPFRELEMGFPPKPAGSRKAELHLLTGENGTGKSTLMYVLAAAMLRDRDEVFKRLRSATADWRMIAGGVIYSTAYSKKNGPLLPIPPSTSLNSEEKERWVFENPLLPRKKNCAWAAFAYSGVRQILGARIGEIKEPESSPLFNALSFSQGDFKSLLQWVAFAKSKSALHAQNGDVERARQVGEAIRQIERAVSAITGRVVEFILDIDSYYMFLRVGGDDLEFDVLPEGLKSILSWVGDLLMRLDRTPWEGDVPLLERPFYLFLDEIDVHLHPAWQRKVLPAVQALFPNAQMFVTTHSPFVVGSVSEGTVHRLALNDDGTARFDKRFDARPGQSVELILEEVFGVPQRFDVETEKKLDELRRLRGEVLSSGGAAFADEWKRLIKELAELGEETSAIASAEERQVARILEKGNGARNGQGTRA